MEILPKRSIDNKKKITVITTAPDWTIPFVDYLLHGILPNDPIEDRRIKIKAPRFAVRDTQLYKRGYLAPWLKCVTDFERQSLQEESHMGEIRAHDGAREPTGKYSILCYIGHTSLRMEASSPKHARSVRLSLLSKTNLSCHLPVLASPVPFASGV